MRKRRSRRSRRKRVVRWRQRFLPMIISIDVILTARDSNLGRWDLVLRFRRCESRLRERGSYGFNTIYRGIRERGRNLWVSIIMGAGNVLTS